MTQAIARVNRRVFSSLWKHRNYRLFFFGQVVSTSGTWMQNVAAAWLVLELTGSPVAVGVLALCKFLPFTLFSPFAGVLVDRMNPRRTVLATQAVLMATAVTLAAVTLAGVVTVAQVYALVAIGGAALVLDAPARQALTFQMVGANELPNAVALNSSVVNSARVVGPAVGGIVIAAAGVGFCFALNAVSFVAVLAGLLLLRVRELLPLERGDERPRVLAGVRESLAYVRRTPLAAVVLGTVLVVSMFSFNFNVLLPVLAKETLGAGPDVFGVIAASFGAGALVGALVSASLGRASPTVLLVGTAGFGLAELLLAPQASVAAAVILLFATGLSFSLWTSNANSTLQLTSPDRLRGRVISLYFFAFMGSGPVAGLLAGWLAEVGGTQLAFTVAGAAALTASVVAALVLRVQRRGATGLRRIATIEAR
ncbi:MAG TPA: MFS transporter [Gaiellaceae bacterium]|nr:MFS transporter [Gaiellaceae bacterium]